MPGIMENLFTYDTKGKKPIDKIENSGSASPGSGSGPSEMPKEEEGTKTLSSINSKGRVKDLQDADAKQKVKDALEGGKRRRRSRKNKKQQGGKRRRRTNKRKGRGKTQKRRNRRNKRRSRRQRR